MILRMKDSEASTNPYRLLKPFSFTPLKGFNLILGNMIGKNRKNSKNKMYGHEPRVAARRAAGA